MKRPSRQAAILSESLNRQLNMYALAANAAGVAILALAQPAEGKIVYTPAHEVVPNCGGHPTLCLKLDLNHDKIVDFQIPWFPGTYTYGEASPYLDVIPGSKQPKNQIWGGNLYTDGGKENLGPYAASALNAGVSIGWNSFKFQLKHQVMFGAGDACGTDSAGCEFGQWDDVQDKYLGLKFYIKGKVHFGWARLTQSVGKHGFVTTLTGYAYETVTNKPIITGKTKGKDVITVQPRSIGQLALGSAGSPESGRR
jgi:hypothetical protein